MTADPRVEAVAEALFVHRDADVFYADIWKNYGCECGWSSELDDADSLREHQAEAVVAVLDKYDEEHGVDLMAYVEARRTEADLRERIAQEIEAECEREGHGGVDDDGFHRLLCARCHTAARIARQQS